MEKVWLDSYPAAVPQEIDINSYRSILDVLNETVAKFKDRPAFANLGFDLTFAELDQLSSDFASFLQSQGLRQGDRIAIQMPNLLQYPVVLFGALRAGLIVVNTNPLYTPREMLHQFQDSQVKAIVVLANFANHLEQILAETKIETIVVTEIADLIPRPKRWLVNFVVKHIKKMVPPYSLPTAFSFCKALEIGQQTKLQEIQLRPDDIAFLQYTGGTTGVSKGAVLTHRNIIANMQQICLWMKPLLREGEEIAVAALPLYHIFCLTVNCLGLMKYGALNVLITNPRDIPSLVKELRRWDFTVFTGVNTLFNALLNNEQFKKLEFNRLKVSVAGGMALQSAVAKKWHELTGTPLVEGYGLTEASPVVCCNPIDGSDRIGSIGLPLPSTEIQVVNEEGKKVGFNEAGELCVRGPQVMREYYQRPEETKKVLDTEGWLKTGDIVIVEPSGFVKIVDRKKDMILVSGFNVYPNEVEEVIALHPKVLEVAAIGVPDERSGEAVKVFIVRKDSSLTEEEVKRYCHEQLVNYKCPKIVEFRDELPKTNVGKILRRALREANT